ncbi:Insulin-induced protein 1 protein [Mortierella sp. AD094]|nr:Insulin-induced protein 1 protein [Mortierella sp. AD094]
MEHDLDMDVGFDLCLGKDDRFPSTLTRSSSSSSLYQLEQSYLRGLPYMTTIITTTTVTTTTTTTTTPTPPVTIVPATTTPEAVEAVPAENWTIARTDGYYSEEDHHQERGEEDMRFLSSLKLVSEGPYLFVFDFPVSLYYPIRALILFVLGFAFSLVVDHLQTQHNLIKYPSNMHQLWDTASWLPPTCGFSAVLIGTLYPLGDYLRRERCVERNTYDMSSVIRCFGGFIGVNYAASKLPWTSGMQTTFTLALISIGLWFWFDRTFHGFLISLTVALVGTMVAYVLVLNGWYSFTRADFFGVGSWIPCILYSSSVCFGSIGRQLEAIPPAWYSLDSMWNSGKDE